MSPAPWFRLQTWRALWIAIRRARKDDHARKNLVRLALSLLIFAAAAGFYFYFYSYLFRGFFANFGATGTAICIAIGLSVILILIIKRLGERRERNAETLTSVPDEIKQLLFRETCILAILLQRLASEAYFEKEIPPEIVIITRRVLLHRLDEYGLRYGLEPALRDLMLAPDGHWTNEQKHRATGALESLAVLRWVLGLSELRPLTSEPKYSVAEARSILGIKKPEKLLVLASWDLRPGRDAARMFFHRCWAELVARREIGSAQDQDVERALAVRAEIQEAGYTSDYVIGTRTIPELDTPSLFFATRRAYHRWQFLSLLVDILACDKPAESLRQFLAQYFAPAEATEKIGDNDSE